MKPFRSVAFWSRSATISPAAKSEKEMLQFLEAEVKWQQVRFKQARMAYKAAKKEKFGIERSIR